MNNAFKSNDRKQPAGNRRSCNGAQDYETKEASCISPTLALEKEFGAGYIGVRGRHCEERVNDWRRNE
jgi:hypothetical protein